MDTAILFIDPYNDFISEGGKFWALLTDVITRTRTIENLRAVTTAAREAGLPIFIVPHHRWQPGDYEGWDHPTPYQVASGHAQAFANGTWGGDWHPEFAPRPGDVVVKEHWGSSGFANTDLDFQLKQRGISKVIVIGLLANTCVETTSRYAVDLGYDVTLVKDATAAYTMDMMRSAHEWNGPTYAHRIVAAADVVGDLRIRAA